MRKPCTHYLRYVKYGNGKWEFDREVNPRIMARMRVHHMFYGCPVTVQYRKVTHD